MYIRLYIDQVISPLDSLHTKQPDASLGTINSFYIFLYILIFPKFPLQHDDRPKHTAEITKSNLKKITTRRSGIDAVVGIDFVPLSHFFHF